MATEGGVESPPAPRIAWSKEQQTFVVVADAAAPTVTSQKTIRRHVRALDDFVVDADDDVNVVDAFISLRSALLKRIEDGASILELPAFVADWERSLERIARFVDDLTTERVCREYHRLAESAMRVGDVKRARRALGRCIHLARTQLDLLETERAAKRLLLGCVQYQHDLEQCVRGLERQHTPPLVATAILERLGTLQALAPYAVDTMQLGVRALLAMHRSKDVVAILTAFPFTATSAPLSLAYAMALEYEGFFQQSITVTVPWCEDPTASERDETAASIKAMTTHSALLTRLLAHKAAGDNALAASRFEEAERAFDDALAMAKPPSRRLRAALLLGRAHARMGLERLLSARRDLEDSLSLDPSNQVTRLRLRTVELSQQTQQLRHWMGR